MASVEKAIADAVAFIRTKINTTKPAVALILGSGLGDLADRIEHAVRIEYADIPHFMTSKVHGHKNCLVVGKLAGAYIYLASLSVSALLCSRRDNVLNRFFVFCFFVFTHERSHRRRRHRATGSLSFLRRSQDVGSGLSAACHARAWRAHVDCHKRCRCVFRFARVN